MAKNDDELLLGAPAPTGKGASDGDGDGDGDGVSDGEELAGTDPSSADPTRRPLDELDPRDGLERPGLEREVAFDPAAAMPEAQSIAGGLDGLTNAGSAIPTGTNHHGVGEDSLLQGRDTNSPLDMQRSPSGETAGGQGSGGVSGGPALSGRGPNWDLVSDETDLDKHDKPDVTPEPPPPLPADPDGYPIPPDPGPVPPVPTTPDLGPEDQTNPDADGGSVTGEQIDLAILRAGGDSKPVEGQSAGPQIDDDQLTPGKRDLVTDPGDDDGGSTAASTGAVPGGRPDAPVVRTINPDSGVVAPPAGGPPPSGGGAGDSGHAVDPTAAALGGDGLQQMDGTADLNAVADLDLDIDVDDMPDEGLQQDTGDLGGPLDDGFD